MKFKKIAIGFLLSLIFVSNAFAANVDCAAAKIHKLGIFPPWGTMVQLEDLATSNKKWSGTRNFYLSKELGQEGLATFLTAFSLGKTVWVRIAGDAVPGSLISIVFINN